MPTEQLIRREQAAKQMNVSDSTERRQRKRGKNWPAHVQVGNRIFYRESSIARWLAAQEGIDREADGAVAAFSPEVEAAIERRAAELVAQAPPFTAEQIVQLRQIFARRAGRED